MFRIGLALVLCGIVGFVGCDPKGTGSGSGDKKVSPLVGTWEGTVPDLKGISLVMNFTADGKFSVETKMEGIEKDPKGPEIKIDGGKQEGTYKLEDKTITTTIDGKEKKLTVKELGDTKMILANEKGVDMTYTKKK